MEYKIKKIVVGELRTNCYIITNELKKALVIDPGDEAEKIIEELKDLKVEGILITHHHYDHIGALKELEEKYELKENGKNSFEYEIIETKGHTSDSISFYFPNMNTIFTGDFIFKGTIGRMDIGGNKEDMKKSINSFLTRFQKNIIIYPGHGNATTLEEERENLETIQNYL